jgi:hypothetical protein
LPVLGLEYLVSLQFSNFLVPVGGRHCGVDVVVVGAELEI